MILSTTRSWTREGKEGLEGRNEGRTNRGTHVGANADGFFSLVAFIMAEQIEKSFQKQRLFHNAKFAVSSKKVGGKDRRWYKDVGLGFKVRSWN